MDPEQVLADAERVHRQGDLAGAESVLAQAWPNMQDAPPDARHLLGMIRMQQGDFGAAEQLLRSAIRTEPNALRHHIALGHILTTAEDPAAAADAYADAVRIDKNWPGLMQNYARTSYRAGRFDEAETAARHALQQTPDTATWSTLSSALREQGKAKEALEAAEQALKLDAANAGAQHSRAAALAALGRAKEALGVLDQLAGQGVEAGAVLITRGRALEQLGRKAEADAAYADAAARWPNDPIVRRALGR